MYLKPACSILLTVVLALIGVGAIPVVAQDAPVQAPELLAVTTGTAFTYQGQLNTNGIPANGSFDFQFKLFDAAGGGTQVGTTQNANAVAVSQGVFTTALDFGAVFDGQARWLEIAVRPAGGGGYTLLAPRQPLTATPYALSLAPGAEVSGGVAGSIFKAVNATADAIAIRAEANNGIGIWGQSFQSIGVYGVTDIGEGVRGDAYSSGTAVRGLSGNGTGVRGASNSGVGVLGQSSEAEGVRGESTDDDGVFGSTYSGAGVSGISTTGTGVRGEAASISGKGVHGIATASSGFNIGVFGESPSSDGIGVYGYNTSESGSALGVWGRSDSPAGRAIYGQATALTGTGAGVEGVSSSASGAGIFGHNTSTGWAGYFTGKVHVNGTLTKSAGSFQIDHPLDPANQYLSHSFVESPDMKNLYDGVVVLDTDGAAEVTLPDWFAALNGGEDFQGDFRYQLTPIGAAMPNLHIAEEIAGNTFRIAGGVPGMKVSWLLTGIRHDPYAEAHRIAVEQVKPAGELGTYLHPELYGQPASLAFGHGQVPQQQERSAEQFASNR